MMLIAKTTAIAISTVLGSDNVYTKLMEKTDRAGQPYFMLVSVNLKCTQPECAHNGDMCWHTAHLIPTWHTIGMHEAARDLLSDSPATRDRELLGQIADEGLRQFPPDAIDRAFSVPTTDSSCTIRFVVVSVDPCNCGSSDYAVVSAAFTTNRMLLLGMDTISPPCEAEQMERTFKAHIAALTTQLAGAHIFLAVEANNGSDIAGLHDQWMAQALVDSRIGYTSLRERKAPGDRRGAPTMRGIWTTDLFKEGATNDFRNSLKANRVCTVRSLFSVQHKDVVSIAREQLKRWTKFYKPPLASGGQARTWIGGKGKLGALNDDLAMCILIINAIGGMLFGRLAAKYATHAMNGVFIDRVTVSDEQ